MVSYVGWHGTSPHYQRYIMLFNVGLGNEFRHRAITVVGDPYVAAIKRDITGVITDGDGGCHRIRSDIDL